MKLPAIVAAALLLAACSGDTPTLPTPPLPVSTLEGESPFVKLMDGQAATLRVIARDSLRAELPLPDLTWTSSDSTVVAVTAGGVIAARGAGRARISATAGSAVANIHVEVGEVRSIRSWPDTVSLVRSGSRQLRALDLGTSVPLRLFGAEWSSSDPAVARVDSTGRVTAVANGSATITSTFRGLRASTEVYVSSYAAPLRFASVSAGGRVRASDPDNACAVTVEGEGFCWGSNERGQLGADRPTDRCERFFEGRAGPDWSSFRCSVLPVRVAGGLRYESISSGGSHACGVARGGKAYCWGADTYGALGDGVAGDGNRTTPYPVNGGILFRAVSAGATHTCGVSTTGTGYCWGDLPGRGSSYLPLPVAAGIVFASIDAGGGHDCGISTDGSAYCWGTNYDGRLGIGTTSYTVVVNATRVLTDVRFRDIHLGFQFTCALATNGRAYCWGSNRHGQLGDGTMRDSSVPVAVAGGLTFTSMGAGADQACGVTSNGATYCWGRRGPNDLAVPTRLPLPFRLRSLGGGWEDPACGITPDELAYCNGASYGGARGVE